MERRWTLPELIKEIERKEWSALLYSLSKPEWKFGIPRNNALRDYLISMLDHPDYHFKCAAASTLGSLRLPGTIDELCKRLNDEDGRVIHELEKSIRKINASAQIEDLLRCFKEIKIGSHARFLLTEFGPPARIFSKPKYADSVDNGLKRMLHASRETSGKAGIAGLAHRVLKRFGRQDRVADLQALKADRILHFEFIECVSAEFCLSTDDLVIGKIFHE